MRCRIQETDPGRGISMGGKNHVTMRSVCIDMLRRHFGHIPTRSTDGQIRPASDKQDMLLCPSWVNEHVG